MVARRLRMMGHRVSITEIAAVRAALAEIADCMRSGAGPEPPIGATLDLPFPDL